MKRKLQEKKREKALTVYRKDEARGEDVEHFFEAFHDLRLEMSDEWDKVSASKTNNALHLFEVTDKMLDGVANNLWNAQIKKYDDVQSTPNVKLRAWEAYKTIMAKFITRDLLPRGVENAYTEQRNYLLLRAKPYSLTPTQWLSRIETIQNYLPYMIGSLEHYNLWVGNNGWKGWWTKGKFRPVEILNIPETRCPEARKVGRKRINFRPDTAEELVAWYEVLAAEEQAKRTEASANKARKMRKQKNEDRSKHREKNSQRTNDPERRSSHYDKDKKSFGSYKKPFKKYDKSSYQGKKRDDAYINEDDHLDSASGNDSSD